LKGRENKLIVKGRAVIKGIAEGEALVSRRPLMGWGNVDIKQGFTVERGHPLYEIPFKGKILVFPYARGSGGFMMYGRTRAFGVNPAGMLFNYGMSVTFLTAMTLKRPVMTDFVDCRDITELIDTGDWVVINADEGYVEIRKGVTGGDGPPV
jgi:predicted aconitase with swiveling domain